MTAALSAKNAAEYMGISVSAFHAWRKRLKFPLRLEGANFYSKAKIDFALSPPSQIPATISLQKNSVILTGARKHETRLGRRKLSPQGTEGR